jgi:beta-lactamase regulating signal transducer with metallopeptidase domain
MINTSHLFARVLSLSIIGSAITGIIVLIKVLLKNKLSPSWHYYIWFLLILRLAVPYIPNISLNVYKASNKAVKQSYQKNEINKANRVTLQNAVSADNGKSYQGNKDNQAGSISKNDKKAIQRKSKIPFSLNFFLLGVIWIIGAAAILTYILIINSLFHRRISKQKHCDNQEILRMFERCKKELGIKKKVKLVYDMSSKTPLVFGLIQPSLLMPLDIIKNLGIEEIRFIFLHELSHIKRKDLFVNWIVILIQSIHWFNPIIWLAFRNMKQDCELACDAQVLSHLKSSEYNVYGQAIIRLVKLIGKPTVLPVAAGIAGNAETKRRIKMISVFNSNSFRKIRDFAGLTAACVLVFTTANSLNFIQDNIVKAANSQAAKPSAQQKIITAKVNSLLQKNNIPEAIKYINSNIKNLSNSNASIVVNNLETAQEKYLPILEKKYDGGNIQQKIYSEYKKDGDLNKIYGIKDNALKGILKQTTDNRYKLDIAEGMYFPVINYELYKKYSNYVTKDIREYINIMSVESNKPSAEDAAISISWNEVIKRGVIAEKFVKSYKNSARYNKVLSLYKNYVSFITVGANNTPLFDYSSNTMNLGARKTYIEAVKNTGDSKLLNVIKEYLKVIQKGNYKLTKDVKVFRDNVNKKLRL